MRVLPTQRKLFAANLLLEGKTAESEEQYQLIEKDFAKSREKVLQNLEKKRKSDKRYAHLFPLRVAKADEFYNPRIAGALAKTSRIFISELIFALESQQNEKLPNLVSELPAESPFHPFINNFKDKAKTVGTNFIFIKTLPLELLKRNFNFFFDLVNSNLNDKAKVYDLFAAHFASQGLIRDLLDVVGTTPSPSTSFFTSSLPLLPPSSFPSCLALFLSQLPLILVSFLLLRILYGNMHN